MNAYYEISETFNIVRMPYMCAFIEAKGLRVASLVNISFALVLVLSYRKYTPLYHEQF